MIWQVQNLFHILNRQSLVFTLSVLANVWWFLTLTIYGFVLFLISGVRVICFTNDMTSAKSVSYSLSSTSIFTVSLLGNPWRSLTLTIYGFLLLCTGCPRVISVLLMIWIVQNRFLFLIINRLFSTSVCQPIHVAPFISPFSIPSSFRRFYLSLSGCSKRV